MNLSATSTQYPIQLIKRIHSSRRPYTDEQEILIHLSLLTQNALRLQYKDG